MRTSTAPSAGVGFSAPEGLPRLLPSPSTTALSQHLDFYGPLPAPGRALVEEVKRSGLRGRGGAGFPAGTKLEAVARRRRTIVVVNGTEGEPVSSKDKTLLAYAPHLVIDGAVLAAEAVGAGEILICVERSATACISALDGALHERGRAGLDRISITLATTPSRYLAGEESALVHWLNGGDIRPTFTPPRPFERGVNGRPTLVNNAETLAHVGLIGRFGAEWFRRIGTPADPGSALVTVGGAVRRTGVYEVPYGISIHAILRACGADTDEVEAVLFGGLFGTWVPGSALGGLALSNESLATVGARVGCGSMVVLPRSACGLSESARIAKWLAGQSAGQCGGCVNGLASISKAMDVLVGGDRDGRARRQLDRWLPMVKGRGACSLPDGAVAFVESSLRVFGSEVERHRRVGRCGGKPLIALPLPGDWR